jgi:prevent-host-death family protein
MKTVGVRELKNSLSEYLRRVRAGESVLVTDRGEVVAELAPPGAQTRDSWIPFEVLSLAKLGLATVGARNHASLYPPLPRRRRGAITSARLLDEERGETR